MTRKALSAKAAEKTPKPATDIDIAVMLCGPANPMVARFMVHPKSPCSWREIQELSFKEALELSVMLDAVDEAERLAVKT